MFRRNQNNFKDRSQYFALGVGVGAALALLFAPKSGVENRSMLKRKAQETSDQLTQKSQELRQAAGEKLNSAVTRARETAATA